MKNKLTDQIGEIYFFKYHQLVGNLYKEKKNLPKETYLEKKQQRDKIRELLFSKCNLLNIIYEMNHL